MPGPQSKAPNSVRPSRPKRRFTLAEANKTLPLVQRVVSDVVHSHAQAVVLQSRLERLDAGRDHQLAEANLKLAMEHLEDYVDELTEIGCELKDYQTGLIDFIGRHEGRDVCLCWKLGEEMIGYWHEMDTGFSGREPISTLHETE